VQGPDHAIILSKTPSRPRQKKKIIKTVTCLLRVPDKHKPDAEFDAEKQAVIMAGCDYPAGHS
jgi:hypothetical protein